MTDNYYNSRYTFNPDRDTVWKEIVRYLDQYIPHKGTVLDMGAGYCDFINNVQAQCRIAVDYSTELPKFAAKGVEVVQSGVTDMSKVGNATVDLVFASNLLEHLSDDELTACMNEVKRVLRKGGLFITMQPNYRLAYKHYFDDPTHKKVFSDEALRAFLASHEFTIVQKFPRFLPFSLKSRPSLLPLHPLIVRTYLNLPWKPFAGQMLFVCRV